MAIRDQFPHYFKQLPNNHVDVYRTLNAFNVTDAALQHAAKKILCAGERGDKDIDKDIAEAIASLQRFQEMRQEDAIFAEANKAAEELSHKEKSYILVGKESKYEKPSSSNKKTKKVRR